ncbi:MAG: epoxide hydrolase [Pseudomonadota bacterium]|nr:epoxide hydrolase [Pseudomonadota bacterium]
MAEARPFIIDVDDAVLDRIRDRVHAFRWFPEPQEGGPWQFGMSASVLREVQDYWLNDYDWRQAEQDLNRWPQYTAKIDGLEIHFLHASGEANGNRPLLLTHGWPGSFFEFYSAIEPLAFPSRHGGKAEDAFDLIIPSLPGYGFSAKPSSPIGQRETARLFDTLMRDVLGYDTYLAQGGDWGAMVTSWLGLNHSIENGGGCRAIHLNMIGFRPAENSPQSEEEAKWLGQMQASKQAGGGYFQQQVTKPQTLAMALMDSPMGTASWILEKFHGWSDLDDADLWSVYSKDQLITNLMIYLVNDAIATSVWYYAAFILEGGGTLMQGQRVRVPTGFASYPGEKFLLAPPPSWIERAYNLQYWADMPKGGHFAAMEVPELFVADIRNWARSIEST